MIERRSLLEAARIGRRTGHAIAECDRCGFVAMLSLVEPGGTKRGLASTPWPKCRACPPGTERGRMVIAPADAEGVARVKYGAAPKVGT